MKAKAPVTHTPGPWRVHVEEIVMVPFKRQIRYGKIEVWPTDQKYGKIVKKTGIGGDHHAHMLANASLIAAAPQLLEALKALCAWHDHPALNGLPEGSPVASWAPSFDETVNMVHAAIKKAEGKR